MKQDLLTDLLRSVSRAFYLSMAVLPAGCRRPIAVGYLLARSADTIADTEQLPPAQRCAALQQFRSLCQQAQSGRLDFPIRPHDPAEARLLERLPDSLALLGQLAPPDRSDVQHIVEQLASGMQEDLEHFPPEQGLQALSDESALERHTYLAAGCVGEFWTSILCRHVASLRSWNRDAMRTISIEFGKALQLTNVLRDIPGDLAQGRCYLPGSELSARGLTPSDLLDPACWPRLQPLYDRWLERAVSYYESAQSYILALPRREIRLRLSVIWPVLIGLATLELLSRHNPLERRRLKVPRSWVYRMMLTSLPLCWSQTAVSSWIQVWKTRVRSRLAQRAERANSNHAN